jgi:hypothetical protein
MHLHDVPHAMMQIFSLPIAFTGRSFIFDWLESFGGIASTTENVELVQLECVHLFS